MDEHMVDMDEYMVDMDEYSVRLDVFLQYTRLMVPLKGMARGFFFNKTIYTNISWYVPAL